MKKVVNYKVEGSAWEEAKNEAYKKLVKKFKIDGFRNGKCPRSVFEKKYGKEINSEAMEKMISVNYGNVLVSEKLIPILEPKLEIVKADNDGFEVNMTFILQPEVTLGKYKDLKVKKEKVSVTKEEIEHEEGHILERFAELVSTDGKAKEGDIVIIDYKGFKDNEEFEGGSGENYSLELGSHTFIPGFEEQIVGMKKEENKDLHLTFPEDYMAKDLAGKDVIFNVTVHDIKRRVIPTLDEEFFKDLDMEGVTNKEEFDNRVKEEILAQKEEMAENKLTEDLLEAASSNMKVEIDEEIIDDEVNYMYKDFVKKLNRTGVSEELYYAYYKTTKEDIMKEMRKEAEIRLRYRYLLEAIITEEKITVTSEEVEEEIAKIIKEYNVTREEIIKHSDNLERIKFDLAMKKALDVLKENN